MRLSTRARYGLRAAVDLALYYEREPVSMASIAERHGISRKYLHTILSQLKSSGFVRSVRGTSGGYVLARDPAQIRVIDILEALEGSLALTDCVQEAGVCHRSDVCVTREVWQDLSRAMETVLSRRTLEDLVLRYRESAEGSSPMYHI